MSLLDIIKKVVGKSDIPFSWKQVGDSVKNQNCFSFALDLPHEVNRRVFGNLLVERGYKPVSDLKIKDIIAYYAIDPDIVGFNHAAIFLGDGKVRDRLGIGGKVYEHPIDSLPEDYICKELGVCWIAFRKGVAKS